MTAKSKKVRINIMMDPEVLAVFDSFCQVTGGSRSSVIHEFLEPAVPALKELIALELRMKLNALSGSDDAKSIALDELSSLEKDLLKPLDNLPGIIRDIQGRLKD